MSGEGVVLVAEDSLVVRTLLRFQLRERGYTVVEAADGEQALARARESRPDVILLDVEMPIMNGFEALAELKRDPALSDIPVVFISGRTSADDAVRGLEGGAHDYLRKPFEASELAARIHAAMRTKALQDQLREATAALARQAPTDPLTGLPTRRLLEELLRRICSHARRHGRPLAVLMMDVDRLSAVNDRHGHAAGDQVLRACADRLAARLRDEDALGRWGGGEFVVVAPETHEAGALALAEALRAAAAVAVAVEPVPTPGVGPALTVSIGVAAWRGEPCSDLLARADAAMHRAKRAGGDRVEAG